MEKRYLKAIYPLIERLPLTYDETIKFWDLQLAN